MAKIGRNEPCICGSRLKYKRCCLENDPNEPPLPGARLQEHRVLSMLLEQSEVFHRFYHVERKKLTKPLVWVDGRNLSSDTKAAATYIENGTLWIQIRWCPVPLDEYQVVMHEMMHCVLWAERYPLFVGQLSQPGVADLMTHVNTALHDPLVEQRLATYGVDPWVDFEQVQRRTIEKLTAWTAEEDDLPPIHLFYGVIYAGFVLDHRVATANMDTVPPNLVADRLAHLAPHLRQHGEAVLEIIDAHGFETPEKMGQLLEILHDRYQLGDVVKVKYP
jgi:hypothetical protein